MRKGLIIVGRPSCIGHFFSRGFTISDIQRNLDIGSLRVIFVTFLLFVATFFSKGFGRDLMLETAVFVVSVKLIMTAYKNSAPQGS
jgi:uncharacterized membrane protein YqaE (UPF0057 family)